MSVTDTLGDMLTRIRNGLHARQAVVEAPFSRHCRDVLDVMLREGFIRGFSEFEPGKGQKFLTIELKYHEGQPGIQKLERISKPGRRVYSRVKKMDRFFNGLGVSILSTPKGVMSDNEARAANVGGEVLCRMF
ncbi:MAG: 30S ribosomal protein S8 [Alphaproteobacteria bacterium]|nr:30S ribosomal protein S8 [Alphaproteobacteria bacterium]NDC55828.1 30S ribosomal protein S8 [Alphaproteobacteria bacterium]NDG03746.1 30S ribosomal protein S8 [Alphaproteobacteria bacterium]